eukprot:gene8984-6306_t
MVPNSKNKNKQKKTFGRVCLLLRVDFKLAIDDSLQLLQETVSSSSSVFFFWFLIVVNKSVVMLNYAI